MQKGAPSKKLDHLQRIDGVAAMPAAQAQSAPKSASKALSPDDIASFRKVGWTFVDEQQPDSNARPVFRDADGHVKIDAGSVNVRFSKKTSNEDIERVLQGHGLAIKRQLGFAPNLFTVSSQSGSVENSVDIARNLENASEIEYAEPVLIEAIPGRT